MVGSPGYPLLSAAALSTASTASSTSSLRVSRSESKAESSNSNTNEKATTLDTAVAKSDCGRVPSSAFFGPRHRQHGANYDSYIS